MTVATTTTAQVYRVYIKATTEAIWQAITDPEWTNRYGYTGYAHYDLRPGGAYRVVPNAEFKAVSTIAGLSGRTPRWIGVNLTPTGSHLRRRRSKARRVTVAGR